MMLVIDEKTLIDMLITKKIADYIEIASDEEIKELDKLMVANIDLILSINTNEMFINYVQKRNGYDIHWFDEMENFKKEISKRGIDFFINFPIKNSIKEYRKISEELFGYYDEKVFSILEFGQYDATRAFLLENIVRELMKHSEGHFTIDDVKIVGKGHYSTAYQINDFVLKIGKERKNNEIKNHRRILQPIIRRRFESESKNENNYYFIEVQNLVNKDCWIDMEMDEITKILFEIYCDLRDDGIVWTDITPQNAGKLLKDNRINYSFTDIDGISKDIRPSTISTGIDRELNSSEILSKGNYVIIDTDYLEKFDEEKMKNQAYRGPRIYLTYKFEERYLKLKNKEREYR